MITCLSLKKKYSPRYERYFYKFIPSKKNDPIKKKLRINKMKKVVKIIVLLVVIVSLTGLMNSCAIFDESSHAQKLKTFKHNKPLPKKYILDNGYKPIAK